MTTTRSPFARGRAGGALAWACAAVAAALVFPAHALSLGRPQGTPLIGRALQLQVPVSLAPGEDLCVRAELAQGDEPPQPLQWRLDPRPEGALLRLASPGLVREPVVTVRLSVGCGDALTQAFVLLADLPAPAREQVPLVVDAPRPANDAAAPDVGAAAPPPAAAAPARPAPVAAAAAEEPPRRRRAARTRASTEERARPAAAPREAAPAPRAERPRAGGARLQVDLLDFAIDQAPALKTTPQLAASAPVMGRAEAQALWQQLNAPPNEQLAALQKQSEATLAELRSLRDVTRRQADQLGRMSAERDLMRDILASLAGAIALALAVLLWRRYRDRGAGPWWQASVRAQPAPAAAPSQFVDSSYPDPALPAPPPAADEDSGWSDLGRTRDEAARPVVPAAVRAGGRTSAFTDSVMGRSRLPSAEELLDVQEKANFFLAIGQTDQAIQMLESRLLEHLGASPFLWLDLIDLCRRHGRRDDYERVRQEFQKAFVARLPAFSEARAGSEGLEHYPRALSRITLLWPTTRVLKEIEKSLFEDPAPGSIMFDLEASRDLLLLYSIAHEVVTEQADGTPYAGTEVGALADHGEAEGAPTTEPVPLMALDAGPAANEEADLDLDLDFSLATQQVQAVPPSAPPAAPEDAGPGAGEAPVAPEMLLDFGDPAAPAPPTAAPGTGEPVAVDVALDDLAPPAPDPTGAEPSAGGPLLDDLALEERPVAEAEAGERVDTTPPEPPLLADLQLDGLRLEEVAPRAEEEEAPLPPVLDFDLPPPTGKAPSP